MVGRKKVAGSKRSLLSRVQQVLEARRPGSNRPRAQAERIATLWLAQEDEKRRAVVKKGKKRHRDDAAAPPPPKRSRRSAAKAKMAATDVEKAKRRVETLEQEKNELMDALMRHLQVDSSGQVVIELLKPENAELKKSLDSVNTQLETAGKDLAEVRRQAAVAQQVCWRCACVCVCVSVSLFLYIFLRDRRRCWMLRGSATR